MSEPVQIVVVHGGAETELSVRKGRILRDVLLEAGLSPYSTLAERANCGGRGLCATCGVRIACDATADANSEPAAEHWHDKLAARFGYPRLSCQLTVDSDMRVELIDDKLLWGGRR